MRMNKTYAIVTPESASMGDFAETGFVYQDKEFSSLLEMAQEIREAGAIEPSSSDFHKGVWYSTIDTEIDYVTGEETTFSFHPDLTEEEEREIFSMIMMDDKAFNQLEEEAA